jgi:cation:H+ antiporter
LPRLRRRLVIIALFVGAGAAVGIAAEPFADGLVETGKQFDISEFLLVQWIAPLASESPEIFVAAIFTLRGNPMFGMAALISAAVNQWTLLVASLPIVFSLGLGEAHGLPLNSQQQAEIFLTLTQILFAVVLISKLQMGWLGAAFLFVIFIATIVVQVIFEEVAPNEDTGLFFRYAFGVTFLVLAAGMMAYDRRHLTGLRDRSVEFYDALRERAGVS